jgi:hypothetical protein
VIGGSEAEALFLEAVLQDVAAVSAAIIVTIVITFNKRLMIF